MGANLAASSESAPQFVIWAQADATSAPLQRLQIIKGWIDAAGETHEDVIDVACADGVAVSPETNRCPDNGATVNLSDCTYRARTGSAELSSTWTDPDFDFSERSFYYARVLEIQPADGVPGTRFVLARSRDLI